MMNKNRINFTPIVNTVNDLIDTVASIGSAIPKNLQQDQCGGVCPPKHQCPPDYLMDIHRTAMSGERIIVPFQVCNEHNNPRSYRVGIRELRDQYGQLAPRQPHLSTNMLHLQPGQSQTVLLHLDLLQFPAGYNYQAEIVLREDQFNQNIRFHLCISDLCHAPTAYPWDENDAYRKWHGWQRHFMCKPQKGTTPDKQNGNQQQTDQQQTDHQHDQHGHTTDNAAGVSFKQLSDDSPKTGA